MKVDYVTMFFPFSSETFTSNDVRELARRGTEMTVHSLRGRLPDTPRLMAQRDLSGIAVTYPPRHVAWRVYPLLRRPRLALDLISAVVWRCIGTPVQLLKSLILVPRAIEIFTDLERRPPDVVHACWAHHPSLVLYLVQRYLPNVVTSISFTAYDIALAHGLSAPVARRADFVRTLAKATRCQVAAQYGIAEEAITVVHDGVDLDLLPPARERTRRRVVTAGRLIEAKGMHHVLRAFAIVLRRWPDASLRILGAGPALGQLRNLAERLGIASAVTFAGHRSQTEVLDEMRGADVFLFLSEIEHLPNVVKEAMVCGCVCVVSATDGINELVSDGVTGFVVPPPHIEAAARHVDDVFAGRVDTDAMRRAAETVIRRDFDMRTSITRYLLRWRDLKDCKRRDPDGPEQGG